MAPPAFRSGELLQPPYYAFFAQVLPSLRAHPRHVLMLEPEAASAFSCTSCGECCQRPWWIHVSYEYYQQWKDVFGASPAFADPFVIREQPTPGNYADFRRKPGTSECIFLMDDKRCHIHATYGEEALTPACRHFPRYEGWYGSFLGRFLLNSCPEVHALTTALPGIRYHLVEIEAAKWPELQALSHPLGLYRGYLWLGLQLDLCAHPALTPIRTLRHLQSLIARLPEPLSSTDESLLNHLQRIPVAAPAPAVPPSPAACEQLLKFLGDYVTVADYVRSVFAGWTAWPVLDPDEKALLNDFLRHYLAYRLLSANYSSGTTMDFFYPFHFMLAMHMAVLQWLALYYRQAEGSDLSREHLLRAATAVGYRYSQRASLIAQFRTLSREASLVGMSRMLEFDFGEAASCGL